MNEGYEYDYGYEITPIATKVSYKRPLEKRLEKYKNRMELIRTIIGVAVLGIQIVIVYHLLTN